MNNHNYVRKMDSIGIGFLVAMVILAVSSIALGEAGYSFISVCLSIGTLVAGLLGILFAHISNKKQFVKRGKDE